MIDYQFIDGCRINLQTGHIVCGTETDHVLSERKKRMVRMATGKADNFNRYPYYEPSTTYGNPG